MNAVPSAFSAAASVARANSDDETAIETLYATGHWLHANERWADAATVFRVMLQVAPGDERSWLALGDCHERIDQKYIALELYSAGAVAAEPSVRCQIARFRVLYDLDRGTDADHAFERAAELALESGDPDLMGLTQRERAVRP